ncbi:hypothetical protein PTKIN_Ptkin10aG0025300 [Pterospermum kingtungense]
MGTTKTLVANRHQHKIPHESHKMKRRSASVLDDSLYVRLDDLIIGFQQGRKRRKLRFTIEDPQHDSEEPVTMDPNITSTANAYTKKSRKKRNSSLHRKLRQRNASSRLHSHLSSSRLRSALQRELPGLLLDVLPDVLQRVFPIVLPEFLEKFNESKNHGQKDGSLNDPKASHSFPKNYENDDRVNNDDEVDGDVSLKSFDTRVEPLNTQETSDFQYGAWRFPLDHSQASHAVHQGVHTNEANKESFIIPPKVTIAEVVAESEHVVTSDAPRAPQVVSITNASPRSPSIVKRLCIKVRLKKQSHFLRSPYTKLKVPKAVGKKVTLTDQKKAFEEFLKTREERYVGTRELAGPHFFRFMMGVHKDLETKHMDAYCCLAARKYGSDKVERQGKRGHSKKAILDSNLFVSSFIYALTKIFVLADWIYAIVTRLIDYFQGIQPWWGEQLWTVQFFILICNIHKHWVTCEVNLTAWAITVYDSLQPIHDEDNLWWNQRCLDLLSLSILLPSMLREGALRRRLAIEIWVNSEDKSKYFEDYKD